MSDITSWLNGCENTDISVHDRALHFGDGLFETFLIDASHIQFQDSHLQRLQKGLKTLSIKLDMALVKQDLQIILQHLEKIPGLNRPWRLKYIVSRGSVAANRIMLLQRYERDCTALQRKGIKARLCQWRLSTQPALAGLKHLNRMDYVMATVENTDEAIFEGFMADQQGRWIEGTMSNVFAVTKSGELITPPLENCGVKGVMREWVLQKGVCQEAYLPNFDDIDELFISNALIGIVPVVQLEQHSFTIGKLTLQLQENLQQHLTLPLVSKVIK